MNKTKTPRKGGLVMKRKQLEKILKQDKVIGLAFGVEKGKKQSDVELNIYRVFVKEEQMVGEEVNGRWKKGASEVSTTTEDCSLFKFEYSNKMQKDKFDFAYLPKDDFEKLFKGKHENSEEVFISAALTDYGNTGSITKKWFTLKIEPRKIVKLEFEEGLKELGTPPPTTVMKGCPPFWTTRDGFDEKLKKDNGIKLMKTQIETVPNL